jgi:hypothetical protein
MLPISALAQTNTVFSLKLYRDCKGISMESSHTVTYSSSTCNVSGSITLNRTSGPIDITPVCPGQATSCNGNGPFGVEEYIYSGILNLPAGCQAGDWILNWNFCCRNNAITTLNGGSGQNMSLSALLKNNNSIGCNSSPVFGVAPASIVCAGDQYSIITEHLTLMATHWFFHFQTAIKHREAQ